MPKLIWPLMFSAFIASPAAAVVVSDTFGSGSGVSPDNLSKFLGASSDFSGVVALYSSEGAACTGALISPTAVLTARHCTENGEASIWSAYFGTAAEGFDRYSITSASSLAGETNGVADYFDGSDMSVFTLSTAVTGIDPFEILTEPEYDETIAIVGFGKSGTGETGDVNDIDWNRRFATNTLDLQQTMSNGNSVLFADFDKADGTENTLAALGVSSSSEGTPYEGLIGPGDSGGPLLFLRDGEWVVGGVATGTRSFDGMANSDFGDLGVWTGIQSQEAIDLVTAAGATFYQETVVPVPLPASVSMFSVALLGLFGWRRLRRTS